MRGVFLVLLMFFPAAAQALSCAPWGVENAFIRAQNSSQLYIVAQGRVSFSERDLPQVDWDNQQSVPAEIRLVGQFNGQTLSKTPLQTPVEIVIRCSGPWCPSPKSGLDYLAFLEQSGSGYVLEFGACGGMGFAQPDRKMLKKLRSCLAGKPCETERH